MSFFSTNEVFLNSIIYCYFSAYPVCNKQQFQCKNKRCISRKWLCDGEDDCRDGSDEAECTTTAASKETCKSGTYRFLKVHESFYPLLMSIIFVFSSIELTVQKESHIQFLI